MEDFDDPFEPSSRRDEKVEALDLLEECWFFNNSLNTTTMMSRCLSDVSPSSNFGQEMAVKKDFVRTPSLPPCLGRGEETEKSKSNHSMDELDQQRLHQKLFQTPTQLPTCVGREEGIQEKQSDSRRNKLSGQSTQRSLLRTPSLPPRLGREEIVEDRESDPPMSKSTRQPSPNLLRHEVL